MFIYLDDSLVVDDTNPAAFDITRAVRHLVNAVYERKHLLYGDYNVISYMREKFRGEPDLFFVLDKIYQQYSFMRCPPGITYYIKVTMQNGPMELDENGVQYSKVSYMNFTDSQNCQPCNLLSEDYNDCAFYRFVLDWYKKKNSYNISHQLTDCSGAGKRTVEYLKQLLFNKKQITLCIVDTDRKYKHQAIENDSTCGTCMVVKYNCGTYHFESIDVHEIENLVPFNIVDNLEWQAESIENKEAFDYLRHNAKSEDILPYFDIKEGLTKDKLFKNDVEYRNFVKVCYYLNPRLFSNGDFDAYVDSLPDNAVIYKHLRKGLLKNFLNYVKENPKCEIELLEYQLDAWCLIGQQMLNMGCCRNQEELNR